jgi:hypothetical protein
MAKNCHWCHQVHRWRFLRNDACQYIHRWTCWHHRANFSPFLYIKIGYGLERPENVFPKKEKCLFFIFPKRLSRLCGPPNLLFNGYRRSFPGVKAAEARTLIMIVPIYWLPLWLPWLEQGKISFSLTYEIFKIPQSHVTVLSPETDYWC